MLNDAELDAMQARCDAAPAEPWVTDEGDDEHCCSIAGVVQQSVIAEAEQRHRGRGDFPEKMPWIAVSPGCASVVVDESAFEFIAASRTDVPRLIAAYRELRRLLTCCRVEDADRDKLTTDGVLALLSAYWVDALPDHRAAFDDAYYAAWESWARPLVDWLVTERRKAAAERDELRRQLDTAIRDQCDDDTAIRAAAKTLLPAEWVDGDSEYVPPVVEIVGRLATELADLKDRVANGAE